VANTRKRVHLPNLYLASQIAFALLTCFARVFDCLSACLSGIHKLGERNNKHLLDKQTNNNHSFDFCHTYLRTIFVQTCCSHDDGRIHKWQMFVIYIYIRGLEL